jgi:hypothetical protein
MLRMRSPFAATLLLAFCACAGGCVTAPEDPNGAIQAFEMRERFARVEIGELDEQARHRMGERPVRKPGHPDDPFPSPRRTIAFTDRDGTPVWVYLYVVATQHAEGCPDVHFEDEPIVTRGGYVFGKGWDFVERHWRAWGGTLEALRDARDHRDCPDAAPPS